MSNELKINPNTVPKVVTRLVSEGLLEVRPGLRTVVAALLPSTAGERRSLLRTELPGQKNWYGNSTCAATARGATFRPACGSRLGLSAPA